MPPAITVFTFFVALPYPLPIPDRSVQGFIEERTELWSGWTGDELGALVGTETFGAANVPGTRMAFRHRKAVVPVPPAAVFDAFKDWIEPALAPDVFQLLSEDTARWEESGVEVVTSIAAISRFIPRSAHPASAEMSVGWLVDLFRRALGDLDSFLEALGMISRDWQIGALEPRSLPPMVPVLFESSLADEDGNRQGATTIVPLHDGVFVPSAVFRPEPKLLSLATALSNEANQGGQPYMLAFRLAHGAEGERLAGDPTRAIIDLNTAIEVLISVTLQEGGRLVGWSEDRIAKATSWKTGLKARVSNHLSALVEGVIETKDLRSPWGRWFSGGYRLRNAAVHEGRQVHKADVDVAFDEAKSVATNLMEQLLRVEALKDLGATLVMPFGDNPEWEGDLLTIRFPWDA